MEETRSGSQAFLTDCVASGFAVVGEEFQPRLRIATALILDGRLGLLRIGIADSRKGGRIDVHIAEGGQLRYHLVHNVQGPHPIAAMTQAGV